MDAMMQGSVNTRVSIYLGPATSPTHKALAKIVHEFAKLHNHNYGNESTIGKSHCERIRVFATTSCLDQTYTKVESP